MTLTLEQKRRIAELTTRCLWAPLSPMEAYELRSLLSMLTAQPVPGQGAGPSVTVPRVVALTALAHIQCWANGDRPIESRAVHVEALAVVGALREALGIAKD